jgi:antitoxin (DNA-binding transcriptional repressor) of toxin-antitoxin stability system
MNKAYKVAEARARFRDLLDEAEGGSPVYIERQGVRFVLEAEAPSPKRTKRRSLIEFVDPAVLSGEWTWELGRKGLKFKARRRRS